MLTTPFTNRFGVRHPIIQAGMSSECGWQLAAAVSNAGALGTIGSLGRTPENLSEEINRCRAGTQQPFAVNVATFAWSRFADKLVDVVIAERVPVVTLSFGDVIPALRRCKAAGLRTTVQVQTMAAARAVLAEGPDLLIVQGHEAGGHTGMRGTLSFAAEALGHAAGTPVAVAGGVGNGRGPGCGTCDGRRGRRHGNAIQGHSGVRSDCHDGRRAKGDPRGERWRQHCS